MSTPPGQTTWFFFEKSLSSYLDEPSYTFTKDVSFIFSGKEFPPSDFKLVQFPDTWNPLIIREKGLDKVPQESMRLGYPVEAKDVPLKSQAIEGQTDMFRITPAQPLQMFAEYQIICKRGMFRFLVTPQFGKD